ncbi:hypothetical protein LSAT2_027502 [Lamellibrachia satsuma]|nr:hypothetical protein LSAT2_027502 [Lamellibrachia satsuma]
MNLIVLVGVVGLLYVIDPKRGNCTIHWTDIWTYYSFNGPWDPTNINTRQSPGLFDLHIFDFNFQETTVLRGQEIDVFKAFQEDWPYYGFNATAELYYTTDRWVTDGAQLNYAASPEYNEFEDYAGRSTLFGFWYSTTSAFQVSCYSGIMRTRPKLLETALRQYITRETGVDLIRVGEIEISISSSSVVDLWVTLFDIPTVKGDLPQRVSRITLVEAVTRLKDAVDAAPARPLVVEYPRRRPAKPSITKGHSEGAMVAVAVTTAVLGLVLGLMVYVILWKKSQSPYLVE